MAEVGSNLCICPILKPNRRIASGTPFQGTTDPIRRTRGCDRVAEPNEGTC
jgi:hypothetical protein